MSGVCYAIQNVPLVGKNSAGTDSGVSGSMAGNITSAVFPIPRLWLIGLQLVWTGTPTGTFQLQVSIDQTNWIQLPGFAVAPPSGGASSTVVDLIQTSFPYLRVVYTRTSGTGTLSVLACGKGP